MVERLGQYELLEKFAEGGMAEVWFGRVVGAEGFFREVAVKRLLASSSRDDELVSMFLDEARLGASLHHPNIVSVLDLGGADGGWFLVMELVDGPHLGRLFAHSLRIHKPLPIAQCAAVVAAAAEGLHYAHERVDPLTGQSLGIVHRDISPQNLLISRHGDVKITDFGVARARSHRSRTRSGVIKGKLGYLTPEQCRGQSVDRRSDVFSLGIVLYELLTRRRLYRGDGEFDVMRRICEEEPVPPGLVTEGVDPTLAAIALRALRKEPSARFQSAAELSDALLAWLQARGHGDWRHELGWWVRNHAAPVWPPLEQRMLRWAEHDAQVGQTLSIDRTRTAVAMQRLPRHMPVEPNVFVGRRAELEGLKARWTAGTRLVCLRGVAGVGKSRLASRHARLLNEEGVPVVLVDLGLVDGARGLASTLADAIGLSPDPDVDAQMGSIGRSLARAGELFVVLDDADTTLDAIATQAPRWLAKAEGLRILVTARRPLRVAGVHDVEVAPLTLPDDDEPIRSDATTLLLARAREARPGFRVSPGEIDALAALVRRLDGLPLAIELAAARLDVLEPSELLARIEAGGDPLRGSGRNGDTGLREVFAASMVDLAPALRTCLGRAVVFAGPFDVHAAEHVVAASDAERADVLGALDALRDRSLLRVRDDGDGTIRFAMLASLRVVAVDALTAQDLAATRLRLVRWLARTSAELCGRVDRHGGADALRRLARLRDDLDACAEALRAADPQTPALSAAASVLQPAVSELDESERLALVRAAFLLRSRLGPRDGLVGLLLASRAAVPSSRSAAALALWTADALLADGRTAEARRELERAISDPTHAAEATVALGRVALRQGRPDEVLSLVERALDRRRLDGQRDDVGDLLLLRAEACASLGRVGNARSACDSAIDALRAAGNHSLTTRALSLAASFALDQGASDAGNAYAGEALELAERTGDRGAAIRARLWLAAASMLQGHDEEAQASLDRCVSEGSGAADAELTADVTWFQVVADTFAGRQARRRANEAVAAAQATGDRRRIVRAGLWLALALMAEGDTAGAEQALDIADGWLLETDSGELRALVAALAARIGGNAKAPAPPDAHDLTGRLMLRWLQRPARAAGPMER